MTFPDEMDIKIIKINKRKEQRQMMLRMMRDELKPCPFCGGKAEIIAYSHDPDIEDWYKVRCTQCFVELNNCKTNYGHEPFITRRQAIDAWNYRVRGAEK